MVFLHAHPAEGGLCTFEFGVGVCLTLKIRLDTSLIFSALGTCWTPAL